MRLEEKGREKKKRMTGAWRRKETFQFERDKEKKKSNFGERLTERDQQ